MASTSKSAVKVYLYDLSQGMMQAMSMNLLGRQFEAIWHSSVVVYGKEYFFGGGIQCAHPGTTSAGRPLRILEFGETEVPKDMLEDYLHGLHDRFNASKYHLLRNNCNHFTQELLTFLTGSSLPDTVTNLPTDFVATPLGAMLAPMIDSMFARLAGDGAPV